MELSVDLLMACEAGLGVPAWIYDEFAPSAAHSHMLAGRAVTGFAAGLAGHSAAIQMQSSMGTGWKDMANPRMAIHADFVADKGGAFNFRRGDFRPVHGGAGNNEKNKSAAGTDNPQRGEKTPRIQHRRAHATKIRNAGVSGTLANKPFIFSLAIL